MTAPIQSASSFDASPADREIWQAARAHAYESYLTALLSPHEVRNDLVVLAAFLGELARIPFLVSEPTLGEIRLQWWRDWLGGLAVQAKPTGNQLADAFGSVIARHKLPIDRINTLLNGRADEGYPGHASDWSEYDAHLMATTGTGFELAARICRIDETPEISALMLNATQAVGTVAILKRLPQYFARGRWPFPDVNSKGSPQDGHPSIDDFLHDSNDQRCASIVAALAAAHTARARAKTQLQSAPRRVRCVVLELALVEPYLRVLDASDFDPILQIAEISPLTQVSRLWFAKWFGRC